MSRMDKLIADRCPDGVPHMQLRSVAEYSGSRIDATQLSAANFVGVDNLLPDKRGRTDATYFPNTVRLTAFQKGDVLLGNIRPYLKKVWLADRSGGCSGDVLVIRIHTEFRDRFAPEFLYYLLSSDAFFAYNMQHAKGAKMPRGSKPAILQYVVPVPPFEVQREIVRILDKFTALEAELEAELEARQKQYAHYRKELLTFRHGTAEEMTLGDLGPVAMCKRVFKAETTADGEIPFYKIGTFGKQADAYIPADLYREYKDRYPFPKIGDVLLSAAGTIGRAIPYDGEPAYFQDSNIVWIDNDESVVTNDYLYHWYQVIDWTTDGGTIKRLYNSNLRRAAVMVPPIEEQNRIVSVLDQFDALVNDLSSGLPAEIAARRKQYEYYRDHLLRFKELAA